LDVLQHIDGEQPDPEKKDNSKIHSASYGRLGF
jgi:hypothetical protein